MMPPKEEVPPAKESVLELEVLLLPIVWLEAVAAPATSQAASGLIEAVEIERARRWPRRRKSRSPW